MSDTSKLIERLRKLAEQQAAPPDQSYHEGKLLTKEDHVYWLAADAIADLEARLRIAEKRADDAEARNDFLIKELDKLIEKARQS
ncbi:MAG TPA: hypothetical protein VFU31_29770 [Candidatus Binatia bacterium]|nr:hypothetical protein [Candidatus Binatia bacterium]